MKVLFYIFIFTLLIACKNKTNKSSETLKPSEGFKDLNNDSIKFKSTIFFPEDHITKEEINKSVSEIDKLISNGNLKIDTLDGFNNSSCEIIKYFKDSSLLMIEFDCGDCTNFMSTEKYYLKNNDLIFVDKSYIDFGYNPCWSETTCKENGITEKIKKKILKTRNEKYYIFDMGFIFTRTGNLNDSQYVSNDTLSIMEILDDVIKYDNAKQ